MKSSNWNADGKQNFSNIENSKTEKRNEQEQINRNKIEMELQSKQKMSLVHKKRTKTKMKPKEGPLYHIQLSMEYFFYVF